jgi:hypothetical protein
MLKMIINIICISIPEEFFITFVSLFFIKVFKVYNHNYLDIHNNFFKNLIKILLISVIPMAILSNILIALKLDESIITVIGLSITPITIILCCNIKKIGKIMMAACITLCVFILSMLNQAIIYIIIFNLTDTTIDYFLSLEKLKILLTIFPRIIEFSIISIILIKKNSIIKTDVVKTILKSKVLIIISGGYIVSNIILSVIICKFIIVDNILVTININNKLFTALIIFTILVINIIGTWVISTFVQMEDRYRYKYGKELSL